MPRRRHVAPRRITCRVSVLWGSLDVALDPVVNDIARDWIDDFSVTYFPHNWHWLAEERPRAVTEHLEAFFASSAEGCREQLFPPRGARIHPGGGGSSSSVRIRTAGVSRSSN